MSDVKIRLTLEGAAQATSGLRGVSGALGDTAERGGRAADALRRVGHYGASAFAAHYVIQYAKALYEASAAGERLATTLQFAGGGARDLGFLRDTADRLGLSFNDSARAYAGLAAAARGTSLAGNGARQVFESVSKASAVMGLSVDDTRGVLLALQQMISKGTVQAEELRGQLGERLPGAFQIAARAMGVTTQELGEMLARGEVLATDFLPRFAKALEEDVGGAAESASQRLDASTARMTNALQRLAQTIGDSGISRAMAALADAGAVNLRALGDSMEMARARGGGAFTQLTAGLTTLIERSLGLTFVTDRVSTFAIQLANAHAEVDRLAAKQARGESSGLFGFIDRFRLDDARRTLAGLRAIEPQMTGNYGAGAGRGDASIQLADETRRQELADAAKRMEAGRVAFMAAFRDNDQKLTAALEEYRAKFAGKVSESQQKADEQAIRAKFAQQPGPQRAPHRDPSPSASP